MLDEGKRVEADKGYQGEPFYICVPDDNNDAQKMAQAWYETANARFKQWKCLDNPFCHKAGLHKYVFQAVAVITQMQINNGEHLFTVVY